MGTPSSAYTAEIHPRALGSRGKMICNQSLLILRPMTWTVSPRFKRSKIAALVLGAARTRKLSVRIVAVTGGGGAVGGTTVGTVGTATRATGGVAVGCGRVEVGAGATFAIRLVIWQPKVLANNNPRMTNRFIASHTRIAQVALGFDRKIYSKIRC